MFLLYHWSIGFDRSLWPEPKFDYLPPNVNEEWFSSYSDYEGFDDFFYVLMELWPDVIVEPPSRRRSLYRARSPASGLHLDNGCIGGVLLHRRDAGGGAGPGLVVLAGGDDLPVGGFEVEPELTVVVLEQLEPRCQGVLP